MIVIEREALARWIRELKLRQTRNDGVDYYTAYLSALTAVEAYMAMMPEYDLDKVADLPHPGLFTPEEVRNMMVEFGQSDTRRFKLGEIIRYDPCEVCGILDGTLRRKV